MYIFVISDLWRNFAIYQGSGFSNYDAANVLVKASLSYARSALMPRWRIFVQWTLCLPSIRVEEVKHEKPLGRFEPLTYKIRLQMQHYCSRPEDTHVGQSWTKLTREAINDIITSHCSYLLGHSVVFLVFRSSDSRWVPLIQCDIWWPYVLLERGWVRSWSDWPRFGHTNFYSRQ